MAENERKPRTRARKKSTTDAPANPPEVVAADTNADKHEDDGDVTPPQRVTADHMHDSMNKQPHEFGEVF
jgi:hypothetical protein